MALNEKKPHRPLALILLAFFTFVVQMPPLIDLFFLHRADVLFRYLGPYYRSVDANTNFALSLSIFLGQILLFVGSIITGIAILEKQRWAWFVGIGLHISIFSIYFISIVLLAPWVSNDRISTMLISVFSLYLLSRSDVRGYLKPVTKT